MGARRQRGPGRARTPGRGASDESGLAPEWCGPDGAPDQEAAPSDERDGRPAKPTEEPARSTPPMATFRHRGQLPEPPPDRLLDDDEPALLDEGALRELVAEIVREELQGGLGERITRNVRKLVRAEIQRAFAARDLD